MVLIKLINEFYNYLKSPNPIFYNKKYNLRPLLSDNIITQLNKSGQLIILIAKKHSLSLPLQVKHMETRYEKQTTDS